MINKIGKALARQSRNKREKTQTDSEKSMWALLLILQK